MANCAARPRKSRKGSAPAVPSWVDNRIIVGIPTPRQNSSAVTKRSISARAWRTRARAAAVAGRHLRARRPRGGRVVTCQEASSARRRKREQLLAAATRGTSRAPRRVEHGCAAGRRRFRTWVASAMPVAMLRTTATHSRFGATTTTTTSGDEATTSNGARWTSYSHG